MPVYHTIFFNYDGFIPFSLICELQVRISRLHSEPELSKHTAEHSGRDQYSGDWTVLQHYIVLFINPLLLGNAETVWNFS